VIIRIERSGGLTGIPALNEMDSKDIPSHLLNTVQKIMMNKKSPTVPLKGTPRDAADYYSYKIFVQDGVNRKVIKCSEYNIQSELKSLVKYIESNSKNSK
jgi:hypothetical protein